MRSFCLMLVVLVARAGEEFPVPSMDRIDHSRPKACLRPCREYGSEGKIRKIAAGLKSKSAVKTLRAIDRWISENFRYDAQAAYEWRDFKRMSREGTYGGCADHAVLFASLARAAGIPVIHVKTMDCDWIREFVAGPEPQNWSGHCFLEVHVEGRWMLLDATGMVLHEDYDVEARILPGNRYAYDKDVDPYRMVKSMRWELWKKQTRAYFKDFDVSGLPVGGGRHLRPRIFVAANAPYYQWIGQRFKARGHNWIQSFNSEFEKWIPQSAGHVLILTSVGGSLVLPEKYRGSHLPLGTREIKKKLKKRRFGIETKSLRNGTQVLLVYARDAEAMRKAVDGLELP